jgi:hypothetical protein
VVAYDSAMVFPVLGLLIPAQVEEPAAGNFYPVTSAAAVCGPKMCMSVVTDRAQVSMLCAGLHECLSCLPMHVA